MEDLPSTLLQSLNIKSSEDISKFLLTSLQWTKFAETYFRNPDDEDEPLILEPGQIKAINALQFGYDIQYVPVQFEMGKPPKIVVMIWPRQTGKTTGVCAGGASMLCLQKGVKIGVMAQSEGMAKEFIDRTRWFIEHSPFRKHLKKSLKMQLIMDHGGYMMAHSTSESIRGRSYHVLILDEAARIEDGIIEGAALDTTRKIGKRVVMLSTPKGYGGTLVKYYQQGLKTRPVICKKCFTKFTQAHFKRASWDALYIPKGLPACPECGYYEEDGPAQYEPDIKEGKTYFYGVGDYVVISINPFSSSFYSREEIMAELHRRGNTPLARQELLGEIIAEGMGVFRKEWLDACTDVTLNNIMKKDPRFTYMMGTDFGKTHDNSATVIGHEDPRTGDIIIDFIKVITSGNIEYEDIKNDLAEIALYFQPIWIIPDATNIGEPIIEFMERDLINKGWKGRIFSNKSKHLGFWFDVKTKPDLIENLVRYFVRQKIRMPANYDGDMEILYNELLNFNYEMTKSNYIKFGVQTEHDDTVIATALMVWGHKSKPWISSSVKFAEPRGGLYS